MDASLIKARESMYHLTLRRSVPAIMQDGLRGGRGRLFSATDTHPEIRRIYGTIPTFLSLSPWMEQNNYDLLLEYGGPADFALFEVDVRGLRLVADIMALIDHGAYLAEDHIWFEDHDSPLAPFEVDGAISFGRLLTPGALAEAAIAWSGTAACLAPIAPERLRLRP